MKLEATGCPDSKRIVRHDGKVLAMCQRYVGGFWAVHDVDTDRRITAIQFSTARKAMAEYVRITEAPDPEKDISKVVAK